MATGYKNDLDEKQAADDQYSPEALALRKLEQNSDEFDNIANNYDQTADDSQENANIDSLKSKNRDSAKNAEENSPWATKISGRGTYGDKPFERGERLTASNIQAILKRKGPLGLLITIFLGGTFTLGGMFTGMLAPFAFAENVTDDLNDQLAALDIRSGAMLRNKIPRADVKESIKGCTKLSIRCKFKTMSRKQVLKYERAGITVTGDKSGVLGNRIAPTEFKFRGEPMDAKTFTNKLKTDQQLRVAYKRAINMKYLGLNDNSFLNRTLKRFGISKRPPELKGSHQDRVNALMNKAGTKDIKDIGFTQVKDKDGNVIDDQWTLNGDTSGDTYTNAQKESLTKSVTKVSTPPSRLSGNLMKGLSVLGYWDLACTIKNMIGAASVAAKLANQYELAQYAMPILSFISQAKAGDISVENGQVLGEFFGSTDSRKEIPDVENAVTTDEETKQIVPKDVVPMKPNPNYGKNVMDSPLYLLSSSGGLNPLTSVETQYSLGMGQRTLLAGFSGFAEILDNIVNLGDACSFVQNWAVRGIGMIVGIVAAVFSGGGTLAVQAATSGGMILASMLLESIINNALHGSILSSGMSEAPIDRAAAMWSGTSSILSESAKNRGMIPGNVEQITAYNSLQTDSKNDYIAVEREGANPLDITNQYSFLGSLSRSLLPYVSGSNSVQSTFGNILSFTSGSLSRAFVPLTTHAATIDPARFNHCDDDAYVDMNIDADVQCNVRYIMPASDLTLDTDEVAKYMETNGYVETDTTTGLPPGYTPPKPTESQGFAMDMLNSTVNTFYDTRNYVNDYGKFLDFCVYRIMPWGETFEEGTQINGVGKEWISGKKCLDTTDPMISNFRVYTFDKTVSEAEDEDAIVIPTDGSSSTAPTPGGSNGTVNPNGWAFPTLAGAPLNQGFSSTHFALDIGGDPSDTHIPIYAMRDGVVMSAGNLPSPYINACVSPTGTIQQTVVIKHEIDGQTYYSAYHHVQAGSFNVQAGSVVKAGDQIALMGNTGCSFGQHLHVELWRNSIYGNGTPIDLGPILYG